MHAKTSERFYQGQSVVLRFQVTDEEPESAFTAGDVSEVTFRISGAADVTLSMSAGEVSLSGDEFIADYLALSAGRYTVTATARAADGKQAVDVTRFEVRAT